MRKLKLPFSAFSDLRLNIASTYAVLMISAVALLIGVHCFEARARLPESLLIMYQDLATRLVPEIEPYVAKFIDRENLIRVLYRLESELPTTEFFVLDEKRNIQASLSGLTETPAYASIFQLSKDKNTPIAGLNRRGTTYENVFTGAPLTVLGRPGYLFIRVDSRRLVPAMGMLFDYATIKWFVTCIFILLVTAVPLGIYVFWVITSPFNKMTRALRSFADGQYSRRVMVPGKNEIGVHAEAFNRMAETITVQKSAIESQDKLLRDFLGRISGALHEPIQFLLSGLEAALSGAKPLKERRELYVALITRFEHMNATVNDLFAIARLNYSDYLRGLSRCRLRELLEEVLDSFGPEHRISAAYPDTPLICKANRDLLSTAIASLIRHASHHCASGQTPHLDVFAKKNSIEVQVLFQTSENYTNLNEKDSPLSEVTGLDLTLSEEILALHGQSLERGTKSDGKQAFCFKLEGFAE